MLFGQLKTAQLKKASFALPKDPKETGMTLKKGNGHEELFLGCAKWGRKEWIGKIYPKGVKEKDFLKYYGQHYDSIELNATNYKIYSAATFGEWVNKVDNPAFKFCPKAHRAMSFLKHSPSRQEVSSIFLKNIKGFGKNLGPIFFTHDERVKWDEQSEKDFFKYLETLPREYTYFVEERWPGFYQDKKLMARYYSRLRELKIGTVITDAAGRQDVLHMQLTIPKAFVRFVGNSLHPSDFLRIDNWATRFRKWLDTGIDEIYFFMHMHDEGKSPELTQYVVKQFNRKCKVGLPDVEFV